MQKILIIDDEPAVRKLMRYLLEKENFEVIEASDGIQGVKSYKEHEPDLVITDLIMPEKEGLEIIQDIKKLKPDAKIIAISGGGVVDPEMYLGLALKFGAAKTFAKPFDNQVLIKTIRSLLS